MTKAAVTLFSDGERLGASLYLPEGKREGPLPGVVLCPGWGGLKGGTANKMAAILIAAGFAALAFDFRGYGESEGKKDRLFPNEQVQDVRAAVAYLRGQEGIDPARVSTMGILNGASAALQAASEDTGIAGVVAFYPFGNGERWMRSVRRYYEWRELERRLEADRLARSRSGQSERVEADADVLTRGPEKLDVAEGKLKAHDSTSRPPRKMTLESADAIVAFKPEDQVHRIAPRPVIVVGVEEDLMVPMAETKQLYERIREPKVLLSVPAISHHEMYDEPVFSATMGQIVKLLQLMVPASRPGGG